ncbi:MAG: hypothetical protein Kow0013_21510 [Pararhodobacter sp.]
MTALEKYARLEGPGVWRADPEAQRRDVVVSLGDSSLVIADARSGMVLSHWSLPAVQRLNRGHKPAVFAPGADPDGETLELDDTLIIEALETIRAALAPRPPLRRLRLALIAGAVLAVVSGLLWLPGVLVERTAAIVPPAMRAQIGREALDALTLSPAGERVCAEPHGRQALATLRTRVLGSDWRVTVVAGVPGFRATHLPGRLIVLGAELIEHLDSPEALAGWMVAEAIAAESTDPLLDALRYAGSRATLALLTTGTLPDGALVGYARHRFDGSLSPVDPEALGARLEALGIAAGPYAMSLPASAAARAQTLADRVGVTRRAPTPLLSDGEWLTLQAICL